MLAGCVLLLAFAGCKNPPAQAPTASSPSPGTSVAERARQAVARQDWPAAAPLLRDAIAAAPGDLSLHYDLAVTASYLDDRAEATREFRWVLANAAPDSAEYRMAKSWLAEPGAASSSGAAGAATETPAPKPVLHVERTGDAGLYGQVMWSSEPGGPVSTKRMQVHLTGLPNSPTKDQRYTVRTDEDGRYEFKRIVGGPYKLTNRVAGKPTWRLRVQVEPGRDTAFDLGPGNSIAARDDFPEDSR